jgi:hypothetical protein
VAAADAEGSFERISAVVEACVYYLKMALIVRIERMEGQG